MSPRIDDTSNFTFGAATPHHDETEWAFAAQDVYEPDGNRDLTTTIISAIAAAEGVPIQDVTAPPLYDIVDGEALEQALFGATRLGVYREWTGSVAFYYVQYKVRVESDGWVTVFEPDEA